MTNTPPTPAEMPKPDGPKNLPSIVPCRAWQVNRDGTTSIERFAAEQVARAEKAEAELGDARQLIARDADEKIRLRELLNEAYPFIGWGSAPEGLTARVYAALHPTTKGDEDE